MSKNGLVTMSHIKMCKNKAYMMPYKNVHFAT